jgi:uncharacterized protein with FMN-binding domain
MLPVQTILVAALYGGTLHRTSARVVKAQSLDVDGISGATISTKIVLKAIDNTLIARP